MSDSHRLHPIRRRPMRLSSVLGHRGPAVLGGGALLAATLLAGCGNGGDATPAWVTQSPSASGVASPTASSTDADSPTASGSAEGSASSSSASAPTEGDPAAVQRQLDQMNYQVPFSGRFDAATRSALKQFQARHGLPQTGIDDSATQAALNQVLASFQATASRTDSAGLVFDGVYWSAGQGDYYRSRNRECVVHEQEWQQAVAQNVGSASVAAHDAAAHLGCNPDSWTPNSISHPITQAKHSDGEKCSQAEEGTIAEGSYPWAVCNEIADHVWKWKVMGV